MTAVKCFSKITFHLLLFIFNSFTKEMPGGGNGRSGSAVFRENLWAICTHDRHLWIWMANFISTASLQKSRYKTKSRTWPQKKYTKEATTIVRERAK